MQYCLQQLGLLFTAQCTRIQCMNRPNNYCLLVCCVLQFICVRLSFLELFRVIVYVCMCAFVVLDFVSSVLYQTTGWEERL